MEYVVLGRTGLQVNKNGFGALPIQRISKEEAGKLLKKAFENGINYFDTARAYSDLQSFRQTTSICTSSTIRPFVRSREMGRGYMRRLWKQKSREKSVISVLQITELQWQKKRFYPVFMRHYSSRFLIWHRKRKRSL